MDRAGVEQCARDMAAEIGLINITRIGLCDRVGIPPGSFASVAGVSFTEFIEALAADEPFGGSDLVVRSRAVPMLREGNILASAVRVSERVGYAHITLGDVAEDAGVSPTLVSRYFGTLGNLRNQVMHRAIHDRVLSVIAQGLATGDPIAKAAPAKLKAQAAKTLTQ